MSPHPFRFGVMAPSPVPSGSAWAALARKVEDLGYDILQLPNHLANQPLAPMVALAAAAAVTSRLRVGTLVVDNELVHPAVIANEASTLDLLSDGRFELGIGAGWLAADHQPIGQRWAPAAERIDRLAEAVEIIRRLTTEDRVSFTGAHYALDGATGAGAGRRCPPLLLGGGGPRMLRLAARVADVVSLVPDMRSGRVGPESAATATGPATRRKLEWVVEAAAGRDVVLHTNVTAVIVTDDRAGGLARIARAYGVDEAGAAEVPHALVGSVEQICDTLEQRRAELGISYLTVMERNLDDFAPVVARLAGR